MKVANFLLLTFLVLGFPNLGLASQKIEIDRNSDFINKTIISGAVKVSVTYSSVDMNPADTAGEKNFSYQIYYDEQKQVEEQEVTQFTGEVFLKDLDNNNIDEVIIRTFSGGAHCCTNHIIYAWMNNQFIKAETGYLDAGGGSFQDLNEDGTYEFVTNDNSFLYQFSSYAGSFPPTLIYRLENGTLENVTTKHPKILRETLQQMSEAIKQGQKENYEINGLLAGYVAQKILLGEYKEGWEFMLANYDHTSDWGLDIYDEQGNIIDHYPDFPTALKAFLGEQQYLLNSHN